MRRELRAKLYVCCLRLCSLVVTGLVQRSTRGKHPFPNNLPLIVTNTLTYDQHGGNKVRRPR